MKALLNLPIFVKALILAVIFVNACCIGMSIGLQYNLYYSPFPYFMTLIALFVVSGIAGNDSN